MYKFELPYLYWIPKLHKNPSKYTCTGYSKCSTKPLSLLLTNIKTAVKETLQTYCATTYARSGMNQIWILYKSKELVNLKTQNFSQINSMKTLLFDLLHHNSS
jgi:hypothetical protein